MKILIISDIHQRIQRAQSIIDRVQADRVILLGDYFDSYSQPIEQTEETAVWLRDFVLPNDKIIPLTGNHDTQYFFNENQFFRCSGFTHEKNAVINRVLGEEHKNKFKFYHIEQGFVFSHAGLTNALWKEFSAKFTESDFKNKLEFFEAVLSYFIEVGIKSAKNGYDVPLFNAGWDRGGIARHGGITWVDWRNFAPINGINQVVGHSICRVPEILVQRVGGGVSRKSVIEYYKLKPYYGELLSVSYALDTCNNHYAVFEDGNVKIFDYQTGIDLSNLDAYFIPESNLNTLS